MKKVREAKFGVIVKNARTGTCKILNETFTTMTKCQNFIDKMNQKNINSSIVFIATTDLSGFKKSQIDQIFNRS